MSEMIERVAQALATSDGIPNDAPLGDYVRNARAAVAVLRKPTEAMLKAILAASGDANIFPREKENPEDYNDGVVPWYGDGRPYTVILDGSVNLGDMLAAAIDAALAD